MDTPDDPDVGYFGPDSVTWRLHRDPAMLVGGLRALLLQALEPRAMSGVVQHSSFADDPVARLQRTSAYVATITYGTRAEADAAARGVRAMHKRVRGIDPHTQRPYAATDPELLLWIHATFVDSMLVAHRRFAAPISAADGDRYVAEQVRAATLVGLPEEMAPTTEAELAAYLAGVTGLRATRDARATAWRLVTLPVSGWMRPLWAVTVGATLSCLPRWAKQTYRLPWCPPVDAAVRPGLFALLRVLQVVLPESPIVQAADARVGATAA